MLSEGENRKEGQEDHLDHILLINQVILMKHSCR